MGATKQGGTDNMKAARISIEETPVDWTAELEKLTLALDRAIGNAPTELTTEQLDKCWQDAKAYWHKN